MKFEFFWTDFFLEITEISNFIKICLVEAELFHAGERIYTAKLIVAISSFANAPKNNF
jgi:hypothetical protein